MRYRITILVILSLIASGCVASQNQSHSQDSSETHDNNSPENQTSALTQNNQSNNTIVFTDSGFQPADITIQQGETVVWVNEASASMWVGSDRHPTHTDYAGTRVREHCQNGDQNSPAFDQCSTGDRFTFTFEKTGEWGYHNHKPFTSGGTITVVE